MFETDRLPKNWGDKLNIMNEIWVPTKFSYNIFEKYGNLSNFENNKTKLSILEQSVNTTFYSKNLKLRFNRIVKLLQLENISSLNNETFVFLSVFKWEERKGWKYLLQSYISEFKNTICDKNENLILLILTNAYHTDDNFMVKINEFIGNDSYLTNMMDGNKKCQNKLIHTIHIVPHPLPNEFMPLLYQIGNCFVLSSLGEGWGRPHVEAMSMGLPIITTNWSGPTQYIKDEYNGYLINVEGFDTIKSGAFRGHKWARPNVTHMKELMRFVYENKEYVKEFIGKNAQNDMREKYCIECIGKQLKRKILEISNEIKIKLKDKNKEEEDDDDDEIHDEL